MLLSKVMIFHKVQSIFYVDNQINFSSHFGTVFSFLTGITFLYISLFEGLKRIKYRKFIIGLIFVFLSYDEYIEIHEDTIHTVKNLFEEGSQLRGIVEYNWVIALSILILIAFLFLVHEIKQEKDVRIKNNYIAGCICFLAAMAIELLSIQLFHKQPYYFVSVTIEEAFEMLGIAFFFYGALDKLSITTTKGS